MGFWDSMAGFGRGVGRVLEQGLQTFGPPIAQAAAGALATRIAGGNNMGGGAYPSAMGYGYPQPQYRAPQIINAPALRPSMPMPQPRQMVPQSWQRAGPTSTGPQGYSAFGQPMMPQGRPQQQRFINGPGGGYQPAGYMSDIVQGGLNYLTEGQFNMPAFPTVTDPGTSGAGLGSELMERARGLFGGQTTMYRYGNTRVTPVPQIQAVNPETGTIGVWKYMGRPILYSGDLAACKRVARVSRRIARRRPR